MSKTLGYPQRSSLVAAKFLSDPFPERWRIGPQIHCDIENFSTHHGDEVGLGSGRDLIVQSAKNTSFGTGVVVLNKPDLSSDSLVELPLVPRLKEESALIVDMRGRTKKTPGKDVALISIISPETHSVE